jgi:hypothetical protein
MSVVMSPTRPGPGPAARAGALQMRRHLYRLSSQPFSNPYRRHRRPSAAQWSALRDVGRSDGEVG